MHRGTYGGKAEQPIAELIGRTAELERLDAVLDRTRAGEGGVCVVWGSAGIGKTRLVAEFARRASAAGSRTAVVACFEYLRPPLGPFDDIFRLLALAPIDIDSAEQIPRADPASAKHARFRRIVDG